MRKSYNLDLNMDLAIERLQNYQEITSENPDSDIQMVTNFSGPNFYGEVHHVMRSTVILTKGGSGYPVKIVGKERDIKKAREKLQEILECELKEDKR